MNGRLLATAALAALPASALAHQPGLSHGAYALEGDRLEVTLRIPTVELAASFPALAGPPERLGAGVPDGLVRAVTGTLAASQRGVACLPVAAAGRPEPPDGAMFQASFRCPRDGEAVWIRPGFVSLLSPGHVHLARDGSGASVVVEARDGGFPVEARGGAAWQRAARFLALGVEHIFGGWDHLAFLVGLLLAGGRLRGVVRVVTSFTAGHALTLALATLGVVSPPSRVIEPLIAASVVYVAVANLRDLRRGAAGEGRRWPVALAFGLVHGFGFAGALAALGLPRAGLAAALLSFNLGVELGQAAVVALVFPLLVLLRRLPRVARGGIPAGSAAVGCAGIAWLVARLPW